MIKYFTIEDLLKHYLQKKFHILGNNNNGNNSGNNNANNNNNSSNKANTSAPSAKTGDITTFAPIALLLAASLSVIAFITKRRRSA